MGKSRSRSSLKCTSLVHREAAKREGGGRGGEVDEGFVTPPSGQNRATIYYLLTLHSAVQARAYDDNVCAFVFG